MCGNCGPEKVAVLVKLRGRLEKFPEIFLTKEISLLISKSFHHITISIDPLITYKSMADLVPTYSVGGSGNNAFRGHFI